MKAIVDDNDCNKTSPILEDGADSVDWKSKYAYLLADFDNYKKRVARERAEIINSANRELIQDFISIVDDMERAISFFPDKELEDDIPISESGVKIIYENMLKLLDAEGCTKIECSPGDKFDVRFHEAISTRIVNENESYEQDDVVSIVQSGWTLNGKLLRPVKVVVANKN